MTPATLTGLAVGDALGMPFETMRAGDPTLKNWEGSFQAGRFGPGQFTDDTQMATALAQSLVENSVYAPAHVASRYHSLFITGQIRGSGSTTRKAMNNLRRVPWVMSGVLDAEGNGTAMRVAPLGLFYHNNVQAVTAFAQIDANITHNSHEARAGSLAVALAVAGLTQGKLDKSNVVHRTLEWLPPSETRAKLFRVSTILDSGCEPREVLRHLCDIGTSSHVVQSVPAAFLAFCGTDSFKDAVETAVRAGGDTDTVAAIAGALAGTFYGSDQVDPYIFDPRNVGLEDGRHLRDLELELLSLAPSVYG